MLLFCFRLLPMLDCPWLLECSSSASDCFRCLTAPLPISAPKGSTHFSSVLALHTSPVCPNEPQRPCATSSCSPAGVGAKLAWAQQAKLAWAGLGFPWHGAWGGGDDSSGLHQPAHADKAGAGAAVPIVAMSATVKRLLSPCTSTTPRQSQP
jgi:hypothetical protein